MIVDHQHAGIFQPHPDEAGEVEHRMALALAEGMKNTALLGIGIEEALDEFAADFVGVLADQGADRGDDAAAVGAELFHRVDGGFQDAGQRAFPAGMRRADHARVGIDEQDRSAIGRGDADRDALPCA